MTESLVCGDVLRLKELFVLEAWPVQSTEHNRITPQSEIIAQLSKEATLHYADSDVTSSKYNV